MDIGLLSLAISVCAIVASVVGVAVWTRADIRAIAINLDRHLSRDEKDEAVQQAIVEALKVLAHKHELIMDRFASAARRNEKQTEVLDRISDQLAALTKDHEHSTERIIERLKEPVRADRP